MATAISEPTGDLISQCYVDEVIDRVENIDNDALSYVYKLYKLGKVNLIEISKLYADLNQVTKNYAKNDRSSKLDKKPYIYSAMAFELEGIATASGYI